MFSPPTFNSFLSLCITNFIVQVIVLKWPSKPANTNSVSQNFKNLGKDIPELPHFWVCPPHFLERIVALVGIPIERYEDTVGVKSMSPFDIKLLFGNLHNITALHHNTNIFSIEIK